MIQIIEETESFHKIDIHPRLRLAIDNLLPRVEKKRFTRFLKNRPEFGILKEMKDKSKSGFEEVAHTADLEIRAWGKDMASLFLAAAEGMFHLSGIEDQDQGVSSVKQTITLEAMDYEGLMILFLEELLYRLTEDYMFYEVIKLTISNEFSLKAQLKGSQISSYQRDIKAVTYHNLNIRSTDRGYEVNIVFDI
jgi:SHS2 domain-containing protein